MGNELVNDCASMNCVGDQQSQKRIPMFSTLQEIQKGIAEFSITNRLIFYPPTQRLLLQNLYSFRQRDLCEVLVNLNSQKHHEQQRKKLLNDISRLNLEKIDQLFWKSLSNSQQELINIKQQDLLSEGNSNIQASKQPPNNPKIKCQSKYEVKNINQLIAIGQQVIRNGQIIVLACVECFNGIGCLSTNSLPSKKTPLEILLDKIEALDDNFHPKSIPIILLTNPHYLEQVTQLCSHNYPTINAHIIKYESIYPCFNQQGQFCLTNSNRLYFPIHNGDLIGFINQNCYIGQLIERYQYLHWVDPCNLLDKICDTFMIGSLKRFDVEAVGKLVDSNNNQCIVVKDGFLEIDKNGQYKQKSNKESHPHLHLSHIVTRAGSKIRNLKMLDTIILTTKTLIGIKPKREKLLLTKVKVVKTSLPQGFVRQVDKDKECFLFERCISDILSQKFTKLYRVDRKVQYARYSVKCQQIQSNGKIKSLVTLDEGQELTPQIVYSNYCKQFLRLKNENISELVEVCPQILFGGLNKQTKIKTQFQKCKKIGFPLIIRKHVPQPEEDH